MNFHVMIPLQEETSYPQTLNLVDFTVVQCLLGPFVSLVFLFTLSDTISSNYLQRSLQHPFALFG